MGRHGFEESRFGQGTYQYTGEDFERDLDLWTESLRPGAYFVWMTTARADGTCTNIGPERLLVTPRRAHWSELRSSEMYSLSFVRCHGRACQYHILVRVD